MYGQLLFAAQLTALFFCFWPLTWHWPLPLTWLLVGLASLGGLWVLVVNRPANWSVFPQPVPHARLITSGPYGLVRHPMYSVVLLIAMALVIHNQTLSALLSWVLLIAILRVKAGYEEALLQERFEHYAGYMRRVKRRFLPGAF